MEPSTISRSRHKRVMSLVDHRLLYQETAIVVVCNEELNHFNHEAFVKNLKRCKVTMEPKCI